MINKKASLTLLAIGLLLFTGCNTSKDTSATTTSSEPTFSPTSVVSKDADILEIGEKMFLTQIDDIYFYFDDYKDKTIIVEGMYSLFYSAEGVKDTPVVFRYGPGCCGNDGWGGFLLNYDGAYPEENEWIRGRKGVV